MSDHSLRSLSHKFFRQGQFYLKLVVKSRDNFGPTAYSKANFIDMDFSAYIVFGHERFEENENKKRVPTRAEVFFSYPHLFRLENEINEVAKALIRDLNTKGLEEGERREDHVIFREHFHGDERIKSVDEDYRGIVFMVVGTSSSIDMRFEIQEVEKENRREEGVLMRIGEDDRMVFLPTEVFLSLHAVIKKLDLKNDSLILISAYKADLGSQRRAVDVNNIVEEEV